MLHLKYDNARWVGSEDLETWMPIVNPELIGDTKKLSFIADKGDPLYKWPGTWGCGKRIVNLGAHIVEHEDAAKLIAPQQPQAEKGNGTNMAQQTKEIIDLGFELLFFHNGNNYECEILKNDLYVLSVVAGNVEDLNKAMNDLLIEVKKNL